MLFDLEEPITSRDFNEKTCVEIAVLLKQDPSRISAFLSESYEKIHWRRLVARSKLFLGRDGTGKLVVMGCISICPTLTTCVARIEEIIIDKDVRSESTERDVFHQLISWAGAMTDAASIELDDRLCAISELILEEARFSRQPRSHYWRRIIPTQKDR
jgi:hypothetical protein